MMKTTICKGDARNPPALHMKIRDEMKRIYFILILILILLSSTTVALGDINLTITSSNNKTINVTQLDTSILEGSIIQGDTISLPYTNHKVTVITDNTMNFDNMRLAVAKVMQSKTYIMVFLLILILVCAGVIIWM